MINLLSSTNWWILKENIETVGNTASFKKLYPYVICKKSFPFLKLILWTFFYCWNAIIVIWKSKSNGETVSNFDSAYRASVDSQIRTYIRYQNYSDFPIISRNYIKYNFIVCQMDFRWVRSSYMYTTEKWKRNFIHEFLNEYWTYVITTTYTIRMHVDKPCHEFDQIFYIW